MNMIAKGGLEDGVYRVEVRYPESVEAMTRCIGR